MRGGQLGCTERPRTNVLSQKYREATNGVRAEQRHTLCITNGKEQKARPKGVNLKGTLESEIRSAISLLGQRSSALYWCEKVVIHRRGNQLEKVRVCLHAVTIQQ